MKQQPVIIVNNKKYVQKELVEKFIEISEDFLNNPIYRHQYALNKAIKDLKQIINETNNENIKQTQE